MSLRDTIASLATGEYVVTREATGTYVHGRYIRSSAYSIEITVVDAAADTLQAVAHGLVTGAGPVRLTTSDTLPTGLSVDTDYWAIASSADLLQLAASAADALALVAIDLEDEGVGTITLAYPAPTMFSIVAVVEPVTGSEIDALPEGQRANETKLVITVTEIRTRSPSAEPDHIDIDGEAWLVVKVDRCQSFGSVHYEALIQRLATP